MPQFERKNYSLRCESKTSLSRPERSQRYLVSEEASLINLTGDVSKICKSAIFEMSLRRCMRRLRAEATLQRCSKEMVF